MFRNRLQKRFRHLRKWAQKEGCQAYRLFDRDIPQFPYIVDYFGDYAVIYERGRQDVSTDKRQSQLQHILDAMEEVLALPRERCICKIRSPQQRFQRYQKLNTQSQLIQIAEGPAHFELNLTDYLDYGLFLDHRPLRRRVYQQAEGKRLLNLFSYTCSFGVMAALGRAHRTTNVDLSGNYLEWGIRNYQLNQIDVKHHDFIQSDVEEYVQYLQQERQLFDLIVFDAPTFSNSKRLQRDWDVQRDHSRLLRHCWELLAEGGVLYFSTNKRKFVLDEEWCSRAQDISFSTIPEDFLDRKTHTCFEFSRN